MTAGPTRCAAHPARPALDACPGCGRPRCAADAAGGDRCAICAGASAVVPAPARGTTEALARTGLAALPVTLAGAAVVSEYVGSTLFQWATPFLLGVAVGAATLFAAGRGVAGSALRWVRAAAVVYALVGAGYSYRFVPGGGDPFAPAGTVLPGYLAAAAGAWLWTVPRRPRRRVSRPDGAAGPSR